MRQYGRLRITLPLLPVLHCHLGQFLISFIMYTRFSVTYHRLSRFHAQCNENPSTLKIKHSEVPWRWAKQRCSIASLQIKWRKKWIFNAGFVHGVSLVCNRLMQHLYSYSFSTFRLELGLYLCLNYFIITSWLLTMNDNWSPRSQDTSLSGFNAAAILKA